MCGIVGYVAKHPRRLGRAVDQFFETALILDTVRGRDSTGVFGVRTDHKENETADWLKQAVNGCAFVETQGFSEYMSAFYHYSVGHNRAATIGDVTTDNAHPFQEGPITMVHNGSLWCTVGLPKSQAELGVEVDSHAICHNLATESVEDVVANLDGAFALVWHDARDNTINFIRNDERPFHMALSTNKESLYFMSEAPMLHAALTRHRVSVGQIVQPEPGLWIKMHYSDLANPEIRKLKLSEYSPPKYAGWGTTVGKRGGSGAATRASGVASPSNDNRVYLGGRTRAVPEPAQEALLEHHGLLVEDRLSFVMTKYVETYARSQWQEGVASGYCVKTGTPVLVYGAHAEAAMRNGDRLWTVRPLTSTGLLMPDGTVIQAVLAKLVSSYGAIIDDKTRTEGGSKGSSEDASADGYAECDLLPGPDGSYIDTAEFDCLVSDGCVLCGLDIEDDDAEAVVWTSDSRPICGECAEDWYNSVGAA